MPLCCDVAMQRTLIDAFLSGDFRHRRCGFMDGSVSERIAAIEDLIPFCLAQWLAEKIKRQLGHEAKLMLNSDRREGPKTFFGIQPEDFAIFDPALPRTRPMIGLCCSELWRNATPKSSRDRSLLARTPEMISKPPKTLPEHCRNLSFPGVAPPLALVCTCGICVYTYMYGLYIFCRALQSTQKWNNETPLLESPHADQRRMGIHATAAVVQSPQQECFNRSPHELGDRLHFLVPFALDRPVGFRVQSRPQRSDAIGSGRAASLSCRLVATMIVLLGVFFFQNRMRRSIVCRPC